MRAEIARLFLEETEKPAIYDEFTSVVDRQVAQVSSHAISKYIRRNDKQFVAVSCHRDIIDWLCPDWIFDTDKNEFQWRRLRRRPEIKLIIREGNQKEWKLFKDYHYLNSTHNASAKKYIAEINEVPVAWCSVLPCPGRIKNLRRIHRLVVRPDYQGLGIGISLLSYVCDCYKKNNYRISIVTSLSFLSRILEKNSLFICTHKGYKTGKSSGIFSSFNRTVSNQRLTATFEYIGDKR